MKPADYFKLALQTGLYRFRSWHLQVLSLPQEDILPSKDNGNTFFKDGKHGLLLDDGTEIIIDHDNASIPLFGIGDKITLSKGDLLSVSNDVKTTVGRALYNAVVLVDSIGDVLAYQNEPFNEKTLSVTIAKLLDDGDITVAEYLKLLQNIQFLSFYTQISVVTTTPRSLSPSPEVKAKLKELLEKYKGQLGDPAIAARIEETLEATDKAYMAGDPSAAFLGKKGTTIRKKMYGAFGPTELVESPGKIVYTENSLSEGLTPKDMPAIINNARVGSFGRSMDTALGGAGVELSSRIFQNTRIAEPDCGTELGVPFKITKQNAGKFVGMYKAKGSKGLTIEDLKAAIGKTLILRHPVTCKTRDGNFCERCMGDKSTAVGEALTARMASIDSKYMLISMAKFHQSALETISYNPEDVIT